MVSVHKICGEICHMAVKLGNLPHERFPLCSRLSIMHTLQLQPPRYKELFDSHISARQLFSEGALRPTEDFTSTSHVWCSKTRHSHHPVGLTAYLALRPTINGRLVAVIPGSSQEDNHTRPPGTVTIQWIKKEPGGQVHVSLYAPH